MGNSRYAAYAINGLCLRESALVRDSKGKVVCAGQDDRVVCVAELS